MGAADRMPQIDGGLIEGRGYNPESELMRAIILRAVEDFRSHGLHFDDAKAFFEDEDEDYLFSFVSICRFLGFNPEKTREQIFHSERRISTRRRAA